MTIHLPIDLESSIRAEVQSGHFASVDEAMAEAARLLLRQRKQQPHGTAITPDELNRQMLAEGLLSQLPNPADDIADDAEDLPIAIEGETLSETIIRERR
jgi:Arc/MetJ-type ribon-helix-helix transcriptional regulator